MGSLKLHDLSFLFFSSSMEEEGSFTKTRNKIKTGNITID
jgi:hypothetical protein